MEEVLHKFENVGVKSEDESKTNFEGLYKNWGKLSNQEARRKDILDSQKQNRHDKVDKFRGVLDFVKSVEDTRLFHSKTYYVPNLFVPGFMRSSATYNDLLMLSEWMIEKPEDFHENWYVVPCPKGRRLLVVATQGVTKYFSKYGQFKFQTYTALPGGNPFDSRGKNTCCVLDCIYDDLQKTVYILDILAWNNLPMTDGEMDFRNYWLQIHVSEIPELKEIDSKNHLIFSLLPKVPCDKESFNEFMMKCPHFENFYPVLDGLLFYHKRGQYLAGKTPIVGWLYPFMVQEILGSDITVNTAYLLEKPEDYVNQADFIEKFESNAEQKVKKWNKKQLILTETTDTLESTNSILEELDPSVSNLEEIHAGDEMEAPDDITDQEQSNCTEQRQTS